MDDPFEGQLHIFPLLSPIKYYSWIPLSYSLPNLPIKVSSTSTHYIVRTELPGFTLDEISVEINNDGLLEIQAERHSKVDKEKGKTSSHEAEDVLINEESTVQNKLQRSMKFPKGSIDINGIKGEFNNGELIIKVPKKKQKKKNIKILKGKL